MNTTCPKERDERTMAVENASYRWGFILLTYGLLIDALYRGIARQEAAWDLLALAIVSAWLCIIYQARQKILTRGWVTGALFGVFFGLVFAAIIAIFRATC